MLVECTFQLSLHEFGSHLGFSWGFLGPYLFVPSLGPDLGLHLGLIWAFIWFLLGPSLSIFGLRDSSESGIIIVTVIVNENPARPITSASTQLKRLNT